MNEFKTYWDLSERERAALEASDVERFIDAELMTKGVLKVAPLELVDEPAEPPLPKSKFYRVKFKSDHDVDVVFTEESAAQTFVALKPVRIERSYLNRGWSESVEHVKPLTDPQIVAISVMSDNDFSAHRAELKRIAAARDENKKRRDEFEKASKEQGKVLDGLWNDWHRCRGRDREHRKVVATFEEYKRIAGGNATIAAEFLLKVFTREQVAEACEWCSVSIPEPGEHVEDAAAKRARDEADSAEVCF